MFRHDEVPSIVRWQQCTLSYQALWKPIIHGFKVSHPDMPLFSAFWARSRHRGCHCPVLPSLSIDLSLHWRWCGAVRRWCGAVRRNTKPPKKRKGGVGRVRGRGRGVGEGGSKARRRGREQSEEGRERKSRRGGSKGERDGTREKSEGRGLGRESRRLWRRGGPPSHRPGWLRRRRQWTTKPSSRGSCCRPAGGTGPIGGSRHR